MATHTIQGNRNTYEVTIKIKSFVDRHDWDSLQEAYALHHKNGTKRLRWVQDDEKEADVKTWDDERYHAAIKCCAMAMIYGIEIAQFKPQRTVDHVNIAVALQCIFQHFNWQLTPELAACLHPFQLEFLEAHLEETGALHLLAENARPSKRLSAPAATAHALPSPATAATPALPPSAAPAQRQLPAGSVKPAAPRRPEDIFSNAPAPRALPAPAANSPAIEFLSVNPAIVALGWKTARYAKKHKTSVSLQNQKDWRVRALMHAACVVESVKTDWRPDPAKPSEQAWLNDFVMHLQLHPG